MDVYQQAGQIVSDNLILTGKILVNIEVEESDNEDSFGHYTFQLTLIIKLLLISVLTSTCFECINSLYSPIYTTL